MLTKLSMRNMKRSARDYLVYILTMMIITALMYAFNSLIFQNELNEYFQSEDMMAMMIGLSTVFIVLIVAWLINYMVKFMLEKRSSEFGIYLLLGMKKKTIARLYMRENLLLGGFAFLIGVVLGILLQQVLMAIMFSMVRMEYHLHISFHKWTILMTVLCYMGCYLLALFRCKRKFKRMNIRDLMDAKRQNEEIKEKYERGKQFLLPLSVLFIFMFWILFGNISSEIQTALFLIGLVFTIYLFYIGLSAWIICYVRKKGKKIYKGQNLFLLRQFASKVRTMQFTMGTLTALFTLALMGASIALMFSEYENTTLDEKFPFDVQVNGDVKDDFTDEITVIEETSNALEYYSYFIYTDGGNEVNTWMLTHLRTFGYIYCNADGTPNKLKIEEMLKNNGVYYPYDTYMGVSDYNHLRKMLGYKEIELGKEEYLVQMKPRLKREVQEIGKDLKLKNAAGDAYLSCAGIYAEPFSQDGHNGADYIIIVPDEVLGRMKPYYSELVVDLDGSAPIDLQKKLDNLIDKDERDFSGHSDGALCYGSDNFINYTVVNLVRSNLIPEVKYMLASFIIPLFYIGLVFICVAVTVLSVQQLSDSEKYKFRYDVLAKLGLGRTKINRLILKQLVAYYLCPVVLAIIISGKMVLFISGRFVLMTGIPTFAGGFLAKSILLFLSIYLIYFLVTYISFKRNVEPKLM